MLRYNTETRPGLVALYDIRPGNGAVNSDKPRSPHGAEDISRKTLEFQYYSNELTLKLRSDPKIKN